MAETVSLRSLRDLAVLFYGDLHEVAVLMLNAYGGRDREAHTRNGGPIGKSRFAHHGLATSYPAATDISPHHLPADLAMAGVTLGTIDDFVQTESGSGDAVTPRST